MSTKKKDLNFHINDSETVKKKTSTKDVKKKQKDDIKEKDLLNDPLFREVVGIKLKGEHKKPEEVAVEIRNDLFKPAVKNNNLKLSANPNTTRKFPGHLRHAFVFKNYLLDDDEDEMGMKMMTPENTTVVCQCNKLKENKRGCLPEVCQNAKEKSECHQRNCCYGEDKEDKCSNREFIRRSERLSGWSPTP